MSQSLNRPSTDSAYSQQVPPSYQDAMRGQSNHIVSVSEKSTQPQSQSSTESSPKKSSRFSTLKSILSGDVYRHHPLYVLEKSVTDSPSSSSSKK